MQPHYTKFNVISSLFWKLMERGGTQGIQFVVQIILARLLSPEQFGTIAIVMVFIALARVFVESGFNVALIQKKDADEIDFSSVFYLSIGVASILYFFIYISAPLVAEFYDDQNLVSILRVLSITLFFGAFNSIQNAYIAKHLMFRKLFVSSLGAVIISGTLGIVAAYHGLGVWALVIQQLANQVSISVILMFVVRWRPKAVFSFSQVKVLFSYGWKLLASELINVLYADLRTLVVGRVYSATMLGFYNRGQQFPRAIVSVINGSIQSVMLPTLSAYQENRIRLKELMRRSIVSSSFVVFPMMVGLAAVAEPMVKIVLTEKWLSTVPFLQIFCISYSLMPIHTANTQAVKAMGRSDVFLRLSIIKKAVGLVILVVSIPLGLYAIAIGMVISGVISSVLNAYPNSKLLDYSYKEQWSDIIPSLAISLVMGLIVYSLNYLNIRAGQLLVVQILVGIILYVGLAKVFRLESFTYLSRTFDEVIRRRQS